MKKSDRVVTDDLVIISLSSSPWAYPYWTSRQFLMYELAQHFPVIYVTSRPHIRELGRFSFWKNVSSHDQSPPFDPPKNLHIMAPPYLTPHLLRYPRIDRISENLFGTILRRQSSRFKKKRILAYVWEPHFFGCLSNLKADKVIYHPYDKFEAFEELEKGKEKIRNLEHQILNVADAVITPHKKIADEFDHANKHVINNGVFMPAFLEPSRDSVESKLKKIPLPRIGYLGSINAKVDFSLMLELAQKKPSWSFILLGPVQPGKWQNDFGFKQLKDLQNVHFLPPISFNKIAAYLTMLDLGIIPYKLSGWAAYSESPLKMYQYWAAKIPIITSPLPNIVNDPGTLSVADSPDDWIQAMESELCKDTLALRKIRYQKAMECSWTKRSGQVANVIRDLF